MTKIDYIKEEIRTQYKDLFSKSLDFIYVHDLKGNFLDANDVTLETFGYTLKEIQNLSFADLLEDESQLTIALETAKEIVINGKQNNRSEYKLKTKNGKTIHVNTYGIPLKRNGDPYAILGIGTDITARKMAELRLKESEKRYRNIFENSPFSIALLNSEGIVIDTNPTTEELFGYKTEEIVGTHFRDVPIIQQKDVPLLLSLFSKMMKGIPIHRIDLQLKRKDNGLIWTNLQGSIVELEDEPYMQVIIHDISKRKEAEMIINQELEKVKELDDLRKNLIIRVSHELKTPLMLISGGIEYLKEQGSVDLQSESLRAMRIIERASDRLTKLVENLIDSTKIEYNKLELSKSTSDLNSLINESIEELKPLIENRNQTIHKGLSHNLHIKLDELRIKQVLTNIILNAIKNTPPGGNISVSTSLKNNSAEISIKDTGIGITEEEKKTLFTRFGKIERKGEDYDYVNAQGSGLGLFISKAIVELHGGKILVESKGRNEGSKFRIMLPIE